MFSLIIQDPHLEITQVLNISQKYQGDFAPQLLRFCLHFRFPLQAFFEPWSYFCRFELFEIRGQLLRLPLVVKLLQNRHYQLLMVGSIKDLFLNFAFFLII